MCFALDRIISLFSRKVPTVEVWADRVSKMATPDGIIAASLIDSIARDFDGWEKVNVTPLSPVKTEPRKVSTGSSGGGYTETLDYQEMMLERASTYPYNEFAPYELRNERRGVVVSYSYSGYHETFTGDIKVNGVVINAMDGRAIVAAYDKVANHRRQIEREAAEALRRQKLNEEKWNLVEGLLGLPKPKAAKICAHGGCHVGCEECCFCEDADE